MQKKIESYWGGMIDLGATSIWEQYLPTEKGAEHYAMYGKKYGCSLCHAWGGGPIYLLGRFSAGVYPTDVGYKTFVVEPKLGIKKTSMLQYRFPTDTRLRCTLILRPAALEQLVTAERLS